MELSGLCSLWLSPRGRFVCVLLAVFAVPLALGCNGGGIAESSTDDTVGGSGDGDGDDDGCFGTDDCDALIDCANVNCAEEMACFSAGGACEAYVGCVNDCDCASPCADACSSNDACDACVMEFSLCLAMSCDDAFEECQEEGEFSLPASFVPTER